VHLLVSYWVLCTVAYGVYACVVICMVSTRRMCVTVGFRPSSMDLYNFSAKSCSEVLFLL
jgi:hypothetical protein